MKRIQMDHRGSAYADATARQVTLITQMGKGMPESKVSRISITDNLASTNHLCAKVQKIFANMRDFP